MDVSGTDVRWCDGDMQRVYYVAVGDYVEATFAAATLSVVFWLAPRGTWMPTVVEFLQHEEL